MKKVLLTIAITIIAIGILPAQKAAITSPTPGSTMSGSTVTFTWNAIPGVADYAVRIGSSPGLYDIGWSGSWKPGLSETFTGLPMDGSTLHVRLYTRINEVFDETNYNDYTYTAYNNIPNAAITVNSPNGGENWIDGSRHNITWTSNGLTGNVVVELIKVILKRPSFSTAKALYTGSVNIGSFSWTINENLRSPLQIGSKVKVENNYIIRITSVSNSSIKDISNRNFKITPKIIVLRPLKPDFEVKDIYKESGGNKFFASIINNGYKYNGNLMLKYLQNRERGAVSQIVDMDRGEIKNILIITKRLELCDKLSLSVEVDSNKAIDESNENNNINQKDFFAISEPDAKLESVKVFSDEGRWVEVRDGGSIRKRAKNIKMQITVRNCGGTRIAGAKVGAMWDFVSQHSGTTFKKRKYFPNSSLFYKQVKKWLPCQDILKNIQELTNKTIRPGMAKTYIITGNLNYSACTGILKIVKNEITVYFNNGESGSRNRNNTLKFRITH